MHFQPRHSKLFSTKITKNQTVIKKPFK